MRSPRNAEQLPERQQREHQPDRVKPDRLADKLRRQHVALEELPTPTTASAMKKSFETWPALNESDAERKHQRGQRSDIGHETQQAAQYADKEAKIEADQRQSDAVPEPQEQADDRLASDETGQSVIYLSGDFSQTVAVIEREPAVDF